MLKLCRNLFQDSKQIRGPILYQPASVIPLVLVLRKCYKVLPLPAVRPYHWHWANARLQHPEEAMWTQQVVSNSDKSIVILWGREGGRNWVEGKAE